MAFSLALASVPDLGVCLELPVLGPDAAQFLMQGRDLGRILVALRLPVELAGILRKEVLGNVRRLLLERLLELFNVGLKVGDSREAVRLKLGLSSFAPFRPDALQRFRCRRSGSTAAPMLLLINGLLYSLYSCRPLLAHQFGLDLVALSTLFRAFGHLCNVLVERRLEHFQVRRRTRDLAGIVADLAGGIFRSSLRWQRAIVVCGVRSLPLILNLINSFT